MIETIRDNETLHRFELSIDGDVAVACYTLAPGVITFTHTEVPSRLRNQGIAARLMQSVLETVRARGLKVVPRCSYVRAYIAKHPEFQNLLA